MRRHKSPLSERTWAVSNEAVTFSSLVMEGEVSAPKSTAPSAWAQTNKRHWGSGTFAALYEIAVRANKRKLLGSTVPGASSELPGFAGGTEGLFPTHTSQTGTVVSPRRICLFLNEKCNDLSDKQAIIWRQYHRLWVESHPPSCQGCDQAQCVFYLSLRVPFHLDIGFLSQPMAVTCLHKDTFHLIS